MINKRSTPRIKFDAKVKVDFSDIEEEDLECTEEAVEANIVDISIEGIRLRISHNVSELILDQLLTGKKKALLNFKLEPEKKTIHTFATLIRHTPGENSLGLKYSNIPADSYEELKNVLSKFTFC